MGLLLMFAVFVATIWVVIKSNMAYSFHNRGVGERKAKAEYARIKREQPDSAEAQISEAEFVEQYVSAVPGVRRYILIALLLLVVGLPVSCGIAVAGG